MNINLTLLGQTISFAVFVWFCMRFVWPPIVAALDERKKRIADGLAAAERGHHEKDLAEKRARDILMEARDKANEVLVLAQRRSGEIIDEAKDSARAEGERMLAVARADIAQEMNRAKERLRQEVVALALAGAEQVLMREVDAKAHGEALKKLAAQL
jgi:F-type H+-transporting ATPase subunit b